MSRRKLTKADYAALNRGRPIKIYPAGGAVGPLSTRARAYSPTASRAGACGRAKRAHETHVSLEAISDVPPKRQRRAVGASIRDHPLSRIEFRLISASSPTSLWLTYANIRIQVDSCMPVRNFPYPALGENPSSFSGARSAQTACTQKGHTPLPVPAKGTRKRRESSFSKRNRETLWFRCVPEKLYRPLALHLNSDLHQN